MASDYRGQLGVASIRPFRSVPCLPQKLSQEAGQQEQHVQ